MTLVSTQLEDLETIAEQTTLRVNGRTNRYNAGWGLPPNIERARAARERKVAEPTPLPHATPPVIAPLPEFENPEVRSYEDLLAACRKWREERNISFQLMDEISGAPAGYSAKLMGPRGAKRIGMQSLSWLLGALGVKLVMMSDAEALAKVESRYQPRDIPHLQSSQRGNTTLFSVTVKHLAEIQAKGRRSRWSKMTPKQRTAWGKRMRKLRTKKFRMKARGKEMDRRARQRRATHSARIGD